jgi:hypothetical protein
VLPVAEKYPDLYYPEYWRALGAVADAVGNEALTKMAERKSKAYAYKDPNIHFNQALRMLGKGEFRAAWRLYEWRLVPGAKNSNRTTLGKMAMWEGENLKGKSILIFLEQGLGDVIFGLRYIKPLEEQGARVEVVGRKPVLPIIHESFPHVKVHDEDEVAHFDYWDDVDGTDFWTYALSIPHRGGFYYPINTGTFLKIPEEPIAKARAIITRENPDNLPCYTINWHGRIDTDSDRTRAFSVEEFVEISGVLDRPTFVISVQKEATDEEVAMLEKLVTKAGGKALNAAPYLDTFAETAGFITASDRLLTCDTSVAHIGGAIGHPTTVLARNKAIWQWLRKNRPPEERLLQGEDEGAPALWYDSVTVKYALAPRISWLFTTFENKIKKEDDNNGTGKSIDDNGTGSQNTEIREGEVRPVRFNRQFLFAGRSGSDKT